MVKPYKLEKTFCGWDLEVLKALETISAQIAELVDRKNTDRNLGKVIEKNGKQQIDWRDK